MAFRWRHLGRKARDNQLGDDSGDKSGGLLDGDWYLRRYPDVAASGMAPLTHFTRYGAREGRDPCALFDTAWYLEQHPDVASSGLDPVKHFLHEGSADGLDPHPLFDTSWYLERYPDVKASKLNPLVHFLRHGASQGFDPNPLFQTRWYVDRYPDASSSKLNPLVHYIERGEQASCDPNVLFDARWYRETNPDVNSSGMNVLVHYVLKGAAQGRDPHLLFDTRWYLERYPDVTASELGPLAHFLHVGGAEGRDPNPLFDSRWYLERYPDAARSGLHPIAHFIEHGAAEGHNPNSLFETRWYVVRYPDAAASRLNPLAHHLQHGRADERAVSPLHEAQLFERKLKENRSPGGRRILDLRQELLPADGRRTEVRRFPLRSVREDMERQHRPPLWAEDGEILSDLEPIILGADGRQRHPDSVTTPGPYIAKLENVAVLGGTRFLLARDGSVLHDEEDFSFDDPSRAVKHPKAWRARDRQLVLTFQREPNTRIERGIHVTSEGDLNYFHAIVEVLPRVLFADAAGVPKDVPLLVTSGLDGNIVDALQCINRNGREIIPLDPDTLYHVDELVYPSDLARILNIYDRQARNEEGLISLKWMRMVRDAILDQIAPDPAPPTRKLYVRRGRKLRALANERQIEEVLIDHGFEIASIEDLSFRAQVKLFSAAAHVVMPTGAGVTNLIWCQPGTAATVLSSDNPLIQHNIWQLVSQVSAARLKILCGPRSHKIKGTYSVHDDYTVDVALLRQELDPALPRLLGQSAYS